MNRVGSIPIGNGSARAATHRAELATCGAFDFVVPGNAVPRVVVGIHLGPATTEAGVDGNLANVL